ncbi:OLC1v1008392C1 [Oldenlandia corymbosa var. corymbosa]|uniref:OLC1v1008392C1 n=1 Tax=Oldenlandia corymbosa var. corymbosa TaxID=529605 RepID=A0AAV1DNZ1_OLDCO|nr:OLC1v1008392C1 [Oldenlandia corymbosa var. corymbosa]
MASQTVSDFASTINSVEKADSIAEKYSFPINLEYRAPIGTERANTLPEGKITVYERSMFLGLRFPLHPLFGRLVQYYKIPLARFTPNLVTAILGFVRLCEIKRVAPRLLVWRYFFKVCVPSTKYKDWYNVKTNVSSKAKCIIELFDGAPSWKSNYLFVLAPDDVCMAWDYRKAHEMGGVADAWSKHDKARIERYRVDIDSLESVEDILGYTEVMSSSKDTVELFGDAKIFEIKSSDDEGLSNKVEEQVPIEVERGEDPSKVTSPIIEEVGAPMPEDLVPEAGPATERHPEWFRPLEASLEKKNVEDTDGSSSYTVAAAIYHFGDNRIECPIIEEVAATLTEEESLKMVIFSSQVMSSRRPHDAPVNVLCLLQLTMAMASILMREKTLKRDIVSLQAERGFLEQERQSSEASRKGEEALRLAREQELDGVQAMYKELEAKLSEYRETHVPRSELPACIMNFWARMMSTDGLASILVGISNEAKFIRPHPKKTLHEALKKGVQQLSDGQLPLFGPLCGAVLEMKSSTEISSFEGEVLTVLPDDAGEEVRVPELAPDFIGVEVEWEEDSSEGQAEDDGQSNPEPEGTSVPPPVEETNENQPTQSQGQKEEEEVAQFPLYAMISSILRKSGDVYNTSKVKSLEKELSDAFNALNLRTHHRLVQRFKQQEEEWKRRLHQYDLDFHASLSLEANIYEEMEKLKSENSQLRRREKIVISPWFLEKLDTLALVESQIKIRTERFIAAIDLLKKRTKEVEFYSKQAAILQNILVDNEISLPILDDLDLEGKARE